MGLVLFGTSFLTAACGDRTELGSPTGTGPDACASPSPGLGTGGFPGADYGTAPLPECSGELATPVAPGTCEECSGPAYLLCAEGFFTKCACAVPQGYTVCQ